MDQPNPPAAVWVDGDPQMEAVAAAIWDQCLTEGSILVDDPRNIAAVAVAAIRTAAEAQQPEPEEQPACGQCGDTGACNGGPCPLLERRERYAVAMGLGSEYPQSTVSRFAAAVMAVADEEQRGLIARLGQYADRGIANGQEAARLRARAEAAETLLLHMRDDETRQVHQLRAELGQARGTAGQDTTTLCGTCTLPNPTHSAACPDRPRPQHAGPVIQGSGYTPGQLIGGQPGGTTPPAGGEQEIRQQVMAAIDAVTGGTCPVDVADAVLPVVRAAVAAEYQRALEDAAMEQNAAVRRALESTAELLAQCGHPIAADLIRPAAAAPASEQAPEVDEMAASLARDGFGADEIATMLQPTREQEPTT